MKLLGSIFFLHIILLSFEKQSSYVCEDCHNLFQEISSSMTSKEGVASQEEIITEMVCSKSDNLDKCEKSLPKIWSKIAQELWPTYFNPKAVWICGESGACGGEKAGYEQMQSLFLIIVKLRRKEVQKEALIGLIAALAMLWLGLSED